MKTGFTNGANRCLVTAVKRGDMDIISVVLGADTKKDRTRDSIKIIEYAFANYQMIDMDYILHEKFDKLIQSTEFNIIKGISNDLKLDLCENDIDMYPVNKEDVKDINVKVELETIKTAPVLKNDKLRKNYHKNRRKRDLQCRYCCKK